MKHCEEKGAAWGESHNQVTLDYLVFFLCSNASEDDSLFSFFGWVEGRGRGSRQ